jgi:energy-coupling factor transporter ATP-binding protein EcfA2
MLAAPEATEEDIELALKEAIAWDFVERLPLGLDTLVGDTGVQLSGGQKQRIAIARALVRRPQILLLDEATSALDTANEGLVQTALEVASRGGRTTVVVAHRISTIIKADIIAAMKDGQVAELGTHKELMARHGLYFSLFTDQVKGRQADNSNHQNNVIHDQPGAGHINASFADQDGESANRDHYNEQNPDAIITVKDQVNNKDEDLQEVQERSVGFSRLLSASKPEWPFILVGVLASVAMGGAMTLFSVLFGAVTRIVSYEDLELARSEAVHYAIMFGLLGLGSTLMMALQGLMFGYSGMDVYVLYGNLLLTQNIKCCRFLHCFTHLKKTY